MRPFLGANPGQGFTPRIPYMPFSSAPRSMSFHGGPQTSGGSYVFLLGTLMSLSNSLLKRFSHLGWNKAFSKIPTINAIINAHPIQSDITILPFDYKNWLVMRPLDMNYIIEDGSYVNVLLFPEPIRVS